MSHILSFVGNALMGTLIAFGLIVWALWELIQ